MPSIAQSDGWRIAVSVKILEAIHACYVMSSRVETSLIFKNRELKWLFLKKAYIQPRRNARLVSCMRKKMNTVLDGYRRDDPTLAAMEEMQSYCLAQPRKSRSGASASDVNAGRSLGCAPWADCGERGRWDWTERGSGTPRFRCAIF